MVGQNLFHSVHQYDLDDHLVVSREGADRVQLLNPLAKYIWDSIREGQKVEVIAAEVARHFDILQEQALVDVNSVIAQWNHGLSAEPRPQQLRTSSSPPKALYSRWQPEVESRFGFPRFSVHVRYDSHEIAGLVALMLGYLAVPSAENPDHDMDIVANDSGQGYLIIVDNRVVETATDPADAAVMAFREIAELACRREDWLIILHAGSVAWQGQGIIFPSSGGAGKTTLTAALIRHGFDYINDDVIPVERGTGKLIPVPISLCIKSGSWPLLQHFYPELENLRSFGRNNLRVKYLPPPAATIGARSYTPQYLIIPSREDGAAPVLESVSPAEGLRAIIEGESLLPQPLTSADVAELTHWVGSLSCYRLTYDKLDPAVQTILDLM
jgi:hypothetical protein